MYVLKRKKKIALLPFVHVARLSRAPIRAETDWVIFTSGRPGMAERRTIVIVTDTPRVCGPSVSTAPSTTAKMPITTRAVPAPLLPPLAMAPRIPTRGW